MSVHLSPLIEAALSGLVCALRARATVRDTEVHVDTIRGAVRCTYHDYLALPASTNKQS